MEFRNYKVDALNEHLGKSSDIFSYFFKAKEGGSYEIMRNNKPSGKCVSQGDYLVFESSFSGDLLNITPIHFNDIDNYFKKKGNKV